jgi:flagellar basal-body rod modification protein FlgD
MYLSTVPTCSGGSCTGGTAAANDLAGVAGADFLNILVKQLQFQDPFEPMSNEEMVSEIATIRELELNSRLSTKLEQLTDQQRFGSAAALIGKYVKGTVTDGEGNAFAAEGIVTGVRFTPTGEVMLELDTGGMLPLTALEQVTSAETLT